MLQNDGCKLICWTPMRLLWLQFNCRLMFIIQYLCFPYPKPCFVIMNFNFSSNIQLMIKIRKSMAHVLSEIHNALFHPN